MGPYTHGSMLLWPGTYSTSKLMMRGIIEGLRSSVCFNYYIPYKLCLSWCLVMIGVEVIHSIICWYGSKSHLCQTICCSGCTIVISLICVVPKQYSIWSLSTKWFGLTIFCLVMKTWWLIDWLISCIWTSGPSSLWYWCYDVQLINTASHWAIVQAQTIIDIHSCVRYVVYGKLWTMKQHH